jgi:hypothetical protein
MAKDPGGKLRAHAWVEKDGVVLIGDSVSPEHFSAVSGLDSFV